MMVRYEMLDKCRAPTSEMPRETTGGDLADDPFQVSRAEGAGSRRRLLQPVNLKVSRDGRCSQLGRTK